MGRAARLPLRLVSLAFLTLHAIDASLTYTIIVCNNGGMTRKNSYTSRIAPSLILWMAPALSALAQAPMDIGCRLTADLSTQEIQQLIDRERQRAFQNPQEVRANDPLKPYPLEVKYGSNQISGCPVHLRSYNGKVVGDTIRAKPGETIYIDLKNMLPPGKPVDPPQPAPNDHDPDHDHDHHHQFTFNITNLHTHGLNTPPQGGPNAEGDNVLLELQPGDSQRYAIHIPDKHPAGTFWYHAHVHGTTSIQVSSGMAGALIVEGGSDANGGLDAVPEIKAAMADGREKIFVLQQLNHDPDGTLESFGPSEDSGWKRRFTYVNGQLTPTIRMRPGEVQRWRFIHAGVQENVSPSLDGHKMYEIAEDGIALGRVVAWPADVPTDVSGMRNIVLGPGYRADFLVQASMTPGTYVLRDDPLPAALSIQASAARLRLALQSNKMDARTLALQRALDVDKPGSVLAFVEIAGDALPMKLPSSDQLATRTPTELTPITDDEVNPKKGGGVAQRIDFGVDSRHCDEHGNCTGPCSGAECNILRYMVNDHVFLSTEPPVQLKLNTASEWTLSGANFPHPFHIHVNPFQAWRAEPDADGKLKRGPDGKPLMVSIWKDTLILPSDETLVKVRSRYIHFKGEFVLHCHILDHEDQGMMQLVKIVD
jgi:FtsP/CotA-like multicopper oxidase with cupredoxin domain